MVGWIIFFSSDQSKYDYNLSEILDSEGLQSAGEKHIERNNSWVLDYSFVLLQNITPAYCLLPWFSFHFYDMIATVNKWDCITSRSLTEYGIE